MEDSTRSDHKFDLEHFSLFLSANLVGGRMQMEKRMAASIASLPPPSAAASLPQSVSLPVYWRSPVLHHVDPSSFWQDTTCSGSGNSPLDAKTDATTSCQEKKKLDLLFLDATVVFRTSTGLQQNNESEPLSTASLSFGAFLRRPKSSNHDDTKLDDEFFYVQGAAVTTSFLTDHVDQYGYVLPDTHARFIAKSTFSALSKVAQGTMVDDDRTLHKIQIPLFYQDDDGDLRKEPCYLEISNRNGPIHPLPQHVASTMILGGPDHNMKDEDENKDESFNKNTLGKEDAKQLLVAYAEWKQKSSTWLRKCDKAAKSRSADSSPSTETEKPKAAIPNKQKVANGNNNNNNNNNNNAKKKSRPAYHGVMRIGGGKKKKPKTATFASGPN
jgi:hypothetical protein